MTVESEVANLTTAVDNLTSSVNVKKATLDASVADSESARDQSQDARDTANLHKLAAEAAATSATNTAAALTGFDLEAIAETKAETAVDVFVYDTSKDSDGGAWRKRTQGTSWYNETLNTATRGSRREFPAVAVVVVEATKVTIYDGDDPALPMWMVFNGGGGNWIEYSVGVVEVSSVAALNNILIVGSKGVAAQGVKVFNFVSDGAYQQRTVDTYQGIYGTTSERNDGLGVYLRSDVGNIVNNTVNDIAMTVLPDAPIDPATGLPVPTIAVATDGGVSVIKDDGTVVDSVRTVRYNRCAFGDDGLYYIAIAYNEMSYATFEDISAGDGFGDKIGSPVAGNQEIDLISYGVPLIREGNNLFIGGTVEADTAKNGVMTHSLNLPDLTKGMSALLTSTYNTGWMNGDIKGAFLSDTDDTDLVGSGELVTNGDGSSLDDWYPFQGGALSLTDGGIRVTNTTGYGGAYQSIPTVIGRAYVISGELVTKSAGANHFDFQVGSTAGAFDLISYNVGQWSSGPKVFVATSTTTYITINVGGLTSGEYKVHDNISVKLADADRSVNANGLIVNGTVTRTAVATGADLVAYSGFSASNYLEQPYNSDLDFGTGDFCVMGWINAGSLSRNGVIAMRSGEVLFRLLSSGVLQITDYGPNITGVTNIANTGWRFFSSIRRAGVGYIFLDGVQDASGSMTGDITSSVPLMLGSDGSSAYLDTSSLALIRIGATAPTAEQIRKIYEDEKVLFQENAQATLYGTSDAVTALAHDSDTGLLHVGTSAGRSVFQGLRRVSNTTTAVGTAISASNGLVVEE